MTEYNDIEAMNSSTLKHALRSMLRMRRSMDGDHKLESDAAKLGTAIHCLVLEPQDFESLCVVMPAFELSPENVTAKGEPTQSKNSKFYRSAVATWREENQGKIELNEGELGVVRKCAGRIKSHPRMRKLLANNDVQREVTLLGEIAGVPCKSRLDMVQVGGRYPLIVDIKTCADCAPHKFGSQFANLHYDFQLAFYREMFRLNYSKEPNVAILAAETSGDYDRAYYPVPEPVLDSGMMKVMRAMQDYKRALQTGEWPGVDRGKDKTDLVIPNWAMEDAGDELYGFAGETEPEPDTEYASPF